MSKLKLANNTTISEKDLCIAHYQLFELMVHFLTQHPNKMAVLREAIVNGAMQKLPKNTISFMQKKHMLDKNNVPSVQICNICESYLNKDGSFKKTFLN
ncbi:hypothetical protein CAXC1_150041 [Candidatus Xenohaliotis californiensis]|uniref:Uncharacterized protein n=1 Tax=Candidatus Xenohaliotis californiensis TaxID=84677 RepID=A0ABP0EVB7_9RICK|nr:hypothetical protein CAXC1_150041 [Candidatus Xenohaliotis californiensis]